MPRIDTGVRIDVDGDRVAVSGPRVRMSGIFDLPWTNYVEACGTVKVWVSDPIPHEKRHRANGAIFRLREITARKGLAEERVERATV